jgi:hypothetical protein
MIPRHLAEPLRTALGDRPVVFVQGPRQAGKSTLVRQLAGGPHRARYLTLDDDDVLGAARADPVGFVGGLGDRVVLDEVQHAPELFRAIKASVDRDRRPGRFLLTGSANVLLLPRVSESLAGRVEILTLLPLSQGEREGRREGFVDAVFGAELPVLPRERAPLPELVERVVRGGYPELETITAPSRRRVWFDSYATTILQRDVRDLANIEGRTELPRLLRLLAARTSSLANVADIARTVGMPYNTAKRYLALLEMTFLFHARPAWSSNLGKRLVRAPKLALVDTGLLAHLLGLDAAGLAGDSRLLGPLLENFVVMEIEKQTEWSDVKPDVFHFRTQSDQEVDVVLEARDGSVVGIEVKAGASIGGGDLKGLRALREMTGKRFRRGVLLNTGAETLRLDDRLAAAPVSALWRITQ